MISLFHNEQDMHAICTPVKSKAYTFDEIIFLSQKCEIKFLHVSSMRISPENRIFTWQCNISPIHNGWFSRKSDKLKLVAFSGNKRNFRYGCIGLQSCIEMQPKKCMQPTDKLELVKLYRNKASSISSSSAFPVSLKP